MSTIDYFKLQAKNLMRDWNTHQEDEELGYVYTPQFFDIDGLLLAFNEDETKFCLQRAQHLIAQLAGFKKWNDLIKASEGELRFAKLVFDACKASDDIVTTSENWKMYYYSNGFDHLDVKNRIYLAQRYFSLSVDDDFEDNPIQDQVDLWYKELKPYVDVAFTIDEYLFPVCNRVDVLTESSKLISEEHKRSIQEVVGYMHTQIQGMEAIRQRYNVELDEITENYYKEPEKVSAAVAEMKAKCIDTFKYNVSRFIPFIINRSTVLKQQLEPESEIVSLLRGAFEEIIDLETTTEKQIKSILGMKNESVSAEEKGISEKDTRNEYWEKAVPIIRRSVAEAFGEAAFPKNRDAFDGRQRESLQLTCIARIRNPIQVSVGIYIKNADVNKNKAVFDYLDARQEDIRFRLPIKDVEIGPADGKGHQPDGERKQYNILVSAKLNVLDKNSWDECCRFHSQVAKALYEYVFIEKYSEIQALLV